MSSAAILNHLRQELQASRLMIVVGTGVTAGATGNAKTASWRGLVEDAVDRCVLLGTRTDAWADRAREDVHSEFESDLIAAAEKATEALGGRTDNRYREWLRDAVGRLEVVDDSLPLAIKELADSGALVLTTNYDDVLEQSSLFPSITWRDAVRLQRVLRGDERAVVHLHGIWSDPESVIFGSSSYADILRDENAGIFLKSLLYTGTVVFVGFGSGLDDPNFSALRRWLRSVLYDSSYSHYRLARESQVAEYQAQHDRTENIATINFGADYSDLTAFLKSIAAGAGASGMRALRPDHSPVAQGVQRNSGGRHIPLPVPASRAGDESAVLEAAERLRVLTENHPAEQPEGPEGERYRQFLRLFSEEISLFLRAASCVTELSAAQLEQAKLWGFRLAYMGSSVADG